MDGFTETGRLAVYSQLRSYESDYDRAQGQIRAIASAWSAAVLAAVALITINSVTPVVVPAGAELHPATVLQDRPWMLLYLRLVICLIGSAGVFVFWFIDQRVYQRLLHSVFAYGLHVEFKNKDLPQVRSAMLASNLDITRWLGLFYRMQLWAFVVLAASFIFFAQSRPLMAFVIIGCHLGGAIIAEACASGWPSLEEIVDNLYSDLGKAWPNFKDRQNPKRKDWAARIAGNPAQPQQQPNQSNTT